ncbi:MAG: T9SS type A sorting domain-containing protein [bacterium]
MRISLWIAVGLVLALSATARAGFELRLSASAETPDARYAPPSAGSGVDSLFLWISCASAADFEGVNVVTGRLVGSNGTVLGFSPRLGINGASGDEIALAFNCEEITAYPMLLGVWTLWQPDAAGSDWTLEPTITAFPGTLSLVTCEPEPQEVTDFAIYGFTSRTSSGVAICPPSSGVSFGCTSADAPADWNGDWATVGSGGANNRVHAALVTASTVVAAGRFTSIGGVSANRVAQTTGGTWFPMGAGLGSNTSHRVLALLEFSGVVVAGGVFNLPSNLARFVGGQWEGLEGSSSGPNAPVQALADYSGKLIVGGSFQTISGDTLTALGGIVSWTETGSWEHLGAGFKRATGNATVRALAVYSGELFAAGDFDSSGSNEVSNLARWDPTGEEWLPLIDSHGDEGISAAGTASGANVKAMTVWDGRLIVGGKFDRAGSVFNQGLAAWNGTDWESFNCVATAGVDDVIAVQQQGGVPSLVAVLPLSGSLAGTGAEVARWDGVSWAALGDLTGITSSGTERGFGLARDGGVVYLVGAFGSVDGLSSADIAKWVPDTDTGAPLPLPSDSPLEVRAVPNPSSASVRVLFDLPRSSSAQISVYDVRGRVVAILRDGPLDSRSSEILWDTRGVGSGVYFVRVESPDGSGAARVVLMK